MKNIIQNDIELTDDEIELFSSKIINSQKFKKVITNCTTRTIPTTNVSQEGHGPYSLYDDQSVRFNCTIDHKKNFLWGINHPLLIKYQILKIRSSLNLFGPIKIQDLNTKFTDLYKFYLPCDDELEKSKKILSILSFEKDLFLYNNIKNKIIIINSMQFEFSQNSDISSLFKNLKKNNNIIFIDERHTFGTTKEVSYSAKYTIDQYIDGILISNQLLKSGLLLKDLSLLSKINFSCKNYSNLDKSYIIQSLKLLLCTSIINKNGKIHQIESYLIKKLKTCNLEFKIIGLVGVTKRNKDSKQICQTLFKSGIHINTLSNCGIIGFSLPISIKLNEADEFCNILLANL